MTNKVKWITREFCDIASIRTEKFNPANSDRAYPCIEMEHLSQVTPKLLGTVPSSEQKSIKNVFYPNDVLFGKLRPYLRKYLMPDFNGVCSTEIWVFKSKPGIDSKYLFDLIQSDRFLTHANTTSGSKMPRADWDFISDVPFLIPPLPEQKRTVRILETWDEAISKLETQISKEKELLVGIRHNLVLGTERLNGFSAPWVNKQLKDLVAPIRRLNTNNVGVVLTISASHGLVDQETYYKKRIAATDLAKYLVVMPGEFAYNKSYSSGYPVGVIKRLNTSAPGVVSSLYFTFRATGANPDYLECYFESGAYDYEVSKVAQEGARNHGLLNISKDEFYSGDVRKPSDEKEQGEIAKIIQNRRAVINLLSKKADRIKQQKQYLLNNLVTGKIAVPAEVKA